MQLNDYQIEYVSTKDNTADILTKPLDNTSFNNLIESWIF